MPTLDILKTHLAFPAVLSLLGAGAVGVWVCANTLSDIKYDAKDTRAELTRQVAVLNTKLDTHSTDIGDLKKSVQDVSWQEHDTKLTLQLIQKQIDAK